MHAVAFIFLTVTLCTYIYGLVYVFKELLLKMLQRILRTNSYKICLI